MATFKQGEIVVDLTTGQQFDVQDGDLDLDPKKYGRIAPEATIAPADVKAGVRQAEEDKALLTGPRQKAVEEAGAFHGSMLKNVGVPLAQAGLAVTTGGMSIPAQMALQGGAELAAQAIGLAPESTLGAVGALASPVAGKVLQRVGRVVGQGVGAATSTPEEIHRIGGEAVAKTLGMKSDLVERTLGPKLSNMLYQAERSGAPVPSKQFKGFVDDAIREQMAMSTKDSVTIERLSNLSRKLASNKDLSAKQVVEEIQALKGAATKQFKQGDPFSGTTLSGTAKGAKQATGKLEAADLTYAKEKQGESLVSAASAANPVRSVDEMIRKLGASNVFSAKELNDVRDIATRIGRISQSDGAFKSLLDKSRGAIGQIIANPVGRAMFRATLGPEGKASPAAISATLQFWRAYQAQEGNK